RALCALGAAAAAARAVAARGAGAGRAGEHAAAAAELASAAAVTAEKGRPRGTGIGPAGRAWLARARAEAARAAGVAGPEPWDAVVDAFAAYGDGYRAAHARWRRAGARLERAAGSGHGDDDRRAAAGDLASAAAQARRLGARPLADAVEALTHRAGDLASRPSAGPPGSPLTPREQAVLEQVARGLTNRAVGEQLFISEKTVSVHLSRAMAKLDASGRAEAVAVAVARGLVAPPT
ncbi:helix-turn-helix transcriptional regulator, partial [Pseudonocardia spirodelae]